MPRLEIHELPLSDIFEDMARLALEHRPGTRAGDVIKLTVAGRSARAIARGAPKNSKNTLHIDLRTRETLGVKLNQAVDVQIEKSGLIGEVLWALRASNAMPRVAARLAVLSVALGFVGFLLGVVSLAR